MNRDLTQICIRQAIPQDAAALAMVEVTSWQAAYRGLMPDAFLGGLSEAETTESWYQNLLKHGPSGRKQVLIAFSAGKGEVALRSTAYSKAGQVWPFVR